MSPSELSWLQGCLFMFLGIAGGYGLNRCQNRQTNSGTSDVELRSIRVENEIATTSFHDAQSSSGDEEARTSPSNPSSPVGEAVVFTGSPSCPARSRLRSKSRTRRRRMLLKSSAKTRKTSLEFGAGTEAPNFVRRETDYNTIVADSRASSLMSSTTAILLRLSLGEVEALSPSHSIGEAVVLSGTPSCPKRKRCGSDSCRRMNAPETRTKSPFENFMAQDEVQNFVRPEPANMIVTDSSSTSMASTPAGLRQPLVPRFSPWEIPLVDHIQAISLDGLRRRTKSESQGPLGEGGRVKSSGVYDRGTKRSAGYQILSPKSVLESLFSRHQTESTSYIAPLR